MASSTAAASAGGRDTRIVGLLSSTLQKLDDFKGRTADAGTYAADVIAAVRANSDSDADFRDQVMCIVANVRNLNGEIQTGPHTMEAAALAAMDASAMRSHQQKQKMAATYRKRAREQTNIDKTSLHCTKCGLVRRDRLNINELALDSEESGSHFDYNFDNVCTCSHSSDADPTSSDEEKSEDGDKRASASSDSGSESESD